jgi:hypothetical protein
MFSGGGREKDPKLDRAQRLGYPGRMWKAILTVLMSLQSVDPPTETLVERVDRMTNIARAIEYAADRATCTRTFSGWTDCQPIYLGPAEDIEVPLISLGYQESGFLLRVHSGNCYTNECDAIRLTNGAIVHRARSPWQVHWNPSIKEEWQYMLGTDQWQTANAAWSAAVIYTKAFRRCRTVEGAVSGYAGWKTCRWPEAAKRVAFMDRVREKLERARDEIAPEPELVAAQ